MTYFAVIKIIDSNGVNKDFEINGMVADKALARTITFLTIKEPSNTTMNVLTLLRKDFDELSKKMFGEKNV